MDLQSPPPPFSSPPGAAGFPIVAIIAVGFLATSLVLTVYYFVVTKFWLNSRQRQNGYMPPIVSSYDTEGRGVDPSVIKSIPVVTFRKGEDGEYRMKNLSFRECAICLAEFREKESIKVLPACSHAFHIDCIDTWLQFNINCPMCRSVVTCSSLPQTQEDHIAGQPDMEARGDERGEGDVIEIRDKKGVGRSLSMDWFSERRNKRGEASSSGAVAVNGDASGRFMRLVHSFRLGQSSRNAVLPIQMEP